MEDGSGQTNLLWLLSVTLQVRENAGIEFMLLQLQMLSSSCTLYQHENQTHVLGDASLLVALHENNLLFCS